MSIVRRDFLVGSGAALGVGVLAACSGDESSPTSTAAASPSGGVGESALGDPDEVRQVLPASTLLALGDGRLLRLGPTADVVELVERGAVLWHAGGTGSELGQFHRITGAAVGPDDTFWIADAGNRRVQVLSATGEALRVLGAPVDGVGPLRRPIGVAVAPDGRCYVGDAAQSAVLPFSADGAVAAPIGGFGSEQPFVGIAALQVAADELVVVEALAPRVQIRDLDGTWLRSIELPAHFRTADLAVDGDQIFLVSQSGLLVRTTMDGATGADQVELLGHLGTHAQGLHLGHDGVIVAAHALPIDLVR
jgi:hypothetical protein